MKALPVPRATHSSMVRGIGAAICVCVLLMMGLAYLMHTAKGEETHARDDKSAPAFAFATEPGGKNERMYIPCKGPNGTNDNLMCFWICPTEAKAVGMPVDIALTSDSNKVTFWNTYSDADPADQITDISFAKGETVSKIVYVRGESPGDAVLHFNDAATGAKLAVDVHVMVLRVDSIEPDETNIEEIDDGDGDPHSRIFLVPVSYPFGALMQSVTITAHITPSLNEKDLPDSVHLEGGAGTAKLMRSIPTGTFVSIVVFKFTICGQDSGLKTSVYLYDARVHLYADKGDLQNIDVGHSWGR